MNSSKIFIELRKAIEDNDMEIFEEVLEEKVIYSQSRKEMILEIIELAEENNVEIMIKNMYIVFISKLEKNNSSAVDIIEIFLIKGLNIHDQIFNGTSLLWAVGSGNLKVISFLIRKGANINDKDEMINGVFPLYHAITQNSDNDVAKFLVKSGADINLQTELGRTALHAACNEKNAEMISFLLEHGANISVEDNDGKTPFFMLINKML